MSVLFLRKPGVIQQPGPVAIDPYWLRRGLQMVVDNGRVVFNREARSFNALTATGGPKSQASKVGRAIGFGTTWGAGTTDRLDGAQLAPPSTSRRSIVAELFPKTTGGGGLGRVYQDATGSGLAVGEALWINSTTGINYTIYVSNVASAAQWTPASPLTLDKWQVLGFSLEHVGSGTSTGYAYIDGKFVASHALATLGSLPGTNPATNMTLGNRANDSARNWDGMIGLILIFDGLLEAKDHSTLAANPRQVFARRQALWIPASGGGTTVTCTVGNAAANGTTAAITRTIATTVGNAAADGTTANLVRTIATSTGNAVADGLTAAVTRTLATTVGNAVADGTTAAVTRGIATTTGSAAADGSTSTVTRIIAAATGNAAAAGITASIVLDGSVTIACTPGNAVADGSLAAVTRTIATTLGNAVADGLTAGLIRTIATTTGNAVADGITASITIAGQTVIGCTPANAVADGAMATVMRTITADPGNAVANGSIAALLRVIAAGPGNAVADGVTASILGATSIVCTPGDAVAAGVTASIVGGQLGAPAYVYAILAESRSYTARTEVRSQAVAAESRTQNVPATI